MRRKTATRLGFARRDDRARVDSAERVGPGSIALDRIEGGSEDVIGKRVGIQSRSGRNRSVSVDGEPGISGRVECQQGVDAGVLPL